MEIAEGGLYPTMDEDIPMEMMILFDDLNLPERVDVILSSKWEWNTHLSAHTLSTLASAFFVFSSSAVLLKRGNSNEK